MSTNQLATKSLTTKIESLIEPAPDLVKRDQQKEKTAFLLLYQAVQAGQATQGTFYSLAETGDDAD